MSMRDLLRHLPQALLQTGLLLGSLCSVSAGAQPYGLGRPATADAIAAWNIDVDALGRGLPPGRGSVAQGAVLYAEKCAACHGANGEGKPADALVGSAGTLPTPGPSKTVGSFWPYATTLYDFINRAMPYTAPQSLKPSEVYALTAWLLHRNGIVPADAVLDAGNLAQVSMPNRAGFVSDPRPDTRNAACGHCR
ncbi:MAG: cytochrome c-type [Polaromonas sp.]|nr:cytochrome c-type [Polaromonas sp.]